MTVISQAMSGGSITIQHSRAFADGGPVPQPQSPQERRVVQIHVIPVFSLEEKPRCIPEKDEEDLSSMNC